MEHGIKLIAIERQEQIEKHGYDNRHDILHVWEYDDWDEFPSNSQSPLIAAALSYLNVDGVEDVNKSEREGDEFDPPSPNIPELYIPVHWPFEIKQWKGDEKTKIERLIIAGALIAAEIDRLQNLNH